MDFKRKIREEKVKNSCKNNQGITLLALIITIVVLVILSGVAINTLYGENRIITTTQDVTVLSNIKTLEEGIELYKVNSNLEGKVEEESYPIALGEDGSRITLSQMKSTSELAKLPDEVKYTLLNLTAEKGTTNIPSLDQIDYNKFYKLDYTKLSISQEEAENLVIYIDGDDYKVINLDGVKYKKNNIYVIIPLNNEAEPEYITVANNTYKLYGDGTLKVLGEKTTNSGYTSSEVNAINNSWDEFDLKAINERFNNRMSLPETLTSDWYAGHVYFSTGTAYVIDQNNDLWAWGANDYNKLGLGHSFLVVEPTKILEGRCEGKENVKASKVWAGGYNTFIVDTEGMLWACGANEGGILGQGNKKEKLKWVRISYIEGKNVKNIEVSSSKAIIIMNDGSAYGAGTRIVQNSQYKFNELVSYKNAKQIENVTSTLWYIDENGDLYGSGYYLNSIAENPVKIDEKVKKIRSTNNFLIYITEENKLYLIKVGGDKKIELNDIDINENTELIWENSVITNNILYYIDYNTGKITKSNQTDNVTPYYNIYSQNEFLSNKNMYVCKNTEGKIYIKEQPNITKIQEKSNSVLREISKDVVFVQGKNSNICMVKRDGKVYESMAKNANYTADNAKKIIASQLSKYVIKNDGTLWARGSYSTGMWGEIVYRNEYVKITKDGTNNFENIKNIFTSKIGNSAIFITEDNKLYWAGSDGVIILPGIKGDFYDVGNGNITYYPKEVTSPLIEKIKDRIKDIEYSYINDAGIYGANTLMLTEDGKLYTMTDNKNMSGNNTVTSKKRRFYRINNKGRSYGKTNPNRRWI